MTLSSLEHDRLFIVVREACRSVCKKHPPLEPRELWSGVFIRVFEQISGKVLEQPLEHFARVAAYREAKREALNLLGKAPAGCANPRRYSAYQEAFTPEKTTRVQSFSPSTILDHLVEKEEQNCLEKQTQRVLELIKQLPSSKQREALIVYAKLRPNASNGVALPRSVRELALRENVAKQAIYKRVQQAIVILRAAISRRSLNAH